MKFKLVKWRKELGNGTCDVRCPHCTKVFQYLNGHTHNVGKVVCPFCAKSDSAENIEGIHFLLKEIVGGSGGKNWECGSCGCGFVWHDGDEEELIWCPNCHFRKGKHERIKSSQSK